VWQGLFSQKIAQVIAQVEKVKVDKGGNLLAAPVRRV
jgi:hypothetical protein